LSHVSCTAKAVKAIEDFKGSSLTKILAENKLRINDELMNSALAVKEGVTIRDS